MKKPLAIGFAAAIITLGVVAVISFPLQLESEPVGWPYIRDCIEDASRHTPPDVPVSIACPGF